ncbi:UPF0598 protein CG30010 [Trichogramma pretiosum]|uniref:UPF0598 protein CG30010 n=1 Tax=Trichogramma pretiosum TaxID=7493 RepID=UPI0006C98F3D|nr:UPF0598 protein CG30010 [Trichogramma pretiosum]
MSRMKQLAAMTRITASAFKTLSSFNCQAILRNCSSYVQGQSPMPKVREYFYFIDHQGMLFLDDTKIKNFTSCFKDKKFLAFFFKRLKYNNTERYKEFPYLSLCGRERNFVRCDDLPIVFTHLIKKQNPDTGLLENVFCYNHAAELLSMPFQPQKIFMSVHSGRVYHPAPESIGGVGLVKSSLAIEFSTMFKFEHGEENPPTYFNWEGQEYKLDQEWFKDKMCK